MEVWRGLTIFGRLKKRTLSHRAMTFTPLRSMFKFTQYSWWSSWVEYGIEWRSVRVRATLPTEPFSPVNVSEVLISCETVVGATYLMTDGWYTGSMEANSEELEEAQDQAINHKKLYRDLKRKIKYLIYEHECFQETLRKTRRSLLKVSRDRSFLLDQLLQYEKVDMSSSDSEETESSDDEASRPEPAKRKRPDSTAIGSLTQSSGKGQSSAKKRKPPPPSKTPKSNHAPSLQMLSGLPLSLLSDGHMTPEEVERHLEAKQTFMELLPEKAPPTVPTEMFSNEPSLDSESNEICELESSPSNLGEDCLSGDIIPD
uniref:INO80 complex subunit E N-terminal domain-containing protein n=1 Tax=Timema poppense TaxID=170557 RepID=A0A7R9D1A1_TIMPO|nr:unnamed protein product [Timema poppensis]